VTHAEYIYPAYAVAVIATLGLVIHAWTAMRRAERAAAEQRERGR
jgi:heme exporter protein D